MGTKVRGLGNSLPDFLSAEILRGFKPGEDFGYLRLWDFEVPSVREYLAEMRRLLAYCPREDSSSTCAAIQGAMS